MRKVCTKCLREKKRKKFNINQTTSTGLSSYCKKCELLRWRTKDGVVTRLYANQISHSKTRGQNPPTFTKSELKDWLFSQKKFHKIYDNWKRLDYQKDYAVSVDRKNEKIGYSLDNIQLMTWRSNNDKSHRDRLKGVGNSSKVCKKVIQKDEDEIVVGTYHSAAEASRATGIPQSSISYSCRGERPHAGGFLWGYLDA